MTKIDDKILEDFMESQTSLNRTLKDYFGDTPQKKDKPKRDTKTRSPRIDEAMDDFVSDNKKLSASYNTMNSAIDKFATVGGTAFPLLKATFEMANNKYDPIMEQLGGLQDITNITNESAAAAVDQIDFIYDAHLGNLDLTLQASELMVKRNGDIHGEQYNALNLYYKDASEVGKNYMKVRDELAQRQGLMLNKMSKEDAAQIGMMERGLQISNRKVASLLERQISLTGEASDKIFKEIGAYADAVADATGVSFQEISGQIADIVTDVERFGNVQVEEAARIAGALNQLGLSYRGFGGMVDKFMNFDSAAESLGNLTTVFGVHFDAMEMMQLANEDQEEFLYRMREAFLDSGKAIEDMTLAEKKLASQQMGMSVQDFENFMQEDRILEDLTGATQTADVDEGFKKITENMKVIVRDGPEMQKFMQNKIMDPLSKSAKKVGDDFNSMKSNFMVDAEKYLPGYQKLQQYMQNTTKATLGTEEYSNLYAGFLREVRDTVASDTENRLKLRDQKALLDEIDAIQAKLDAGEKINMASFLKVGMSESAGPEFMKFMSGYTKRGVVKGLEDSEAIIKEYERRIALSESDPLRLDPTKGMNQGGFSKEALLERQQQIKQQMEEGIDAPNKGDGSTMLNILPDPEDVVEQAVAVAEVANTELEKKGITKTPGGLVRVVNAGTGLVGDLLESGMKSGELANVTQTAELVKVKEGIFQMGAALIKLTSDDNVINNVISLDGHVLAQYLFNYLQPGTGKGFKTNKTNMV